MFFNNFLLIRPTFNLNTHHGLLPTSHRHPAATAGLDRWQCGTAPPAHNQSHSPLFPSTNLTTLPTRCTIGISSCGAEMGGCKYGVHARALVEDVTDAAFQFTSAWSSYSQNKSSFRRAASKSNSPPSHRTGHPESWGWARVQMQVREHQKTHGCTPRPGFSTKYTNTYSLF